jgi:hypothetical protein
MRLLAQIALVGLLVLAASCASDLESRLSKGITPPSVGTLIVYFDPSECLSCDGYLTWWSAQRLRGKAIVFVASRAPSAQEAVTLRRWRVNVDAVVRGSAPAGAVVYEWETPRLRYVGLARDLEGP